MREHVISSAVVVCLPGREGEVAAEVARLSGVEIWASERARLVLVLEGPTRSEVGDRLTHIAMIEGVVAANMVFEHVDSDEETAA